MPVWSICVSLLVAFAVWLAPRERRGGMIFEFAVVAVAVPFLTLLPMWLAILLATVVGVVASVVRGVCSALWGVRINDWVAARCGTFVGDALASVGLGGDAYDRKCAAVRGHEVA